MGTALHRGWTPRSLERLPEGEWQATLQRVRSEFQEMPCLCLTFDQARTLLGLSAPSCEWILSRLETDGFLSRTAQGEYVRRCTEP